MNLYMLPYFVTMLLLTPNNPTTFKFEKPIEFFSLSKDFYTYQSKDKKILVVKPLRPSFDTTFSVIMEKSSYQFRIKSSKAFQQSLFIVKDAKQDRIYEKVTDTKAYKILKGTNTLRVHNKLKAITINDIKFFKKVITLPLGTYLKVNNETINY